MSYVSVKKGRLYLCWHEKLLKKSKCKSLGLRDTKRNRQKAKKMQREFDEISKEEQKKITRPKKEFLRSTIAEAKEKFYKMNSNRKSSTIKTYDYFFRKFLNGKHFRINDNVNVINKTNVEEWLLWLGSLNLSQNTLFDLSKNLKKFVRFLQEYGYIETFSLNSDLTYKMPAGEIVVFSQEDIQLMLEHVKEKSEQFQITFYLLLFTGLRPTDLLNSKVKDLNVKKLTFSYYSPKVDKYQTIAITSELVENIYPLIRNKNPEDKLVQYADLHNIGRAFRQFIKEMGLSNKGYTLRTFRKTFISIAYEKGVDYVTLSRLIGHSNIRTTAKYYTQFSLAKQHEEVNKISFYKNEKATIYNFDGQQVGKTESKTESLLEKASNL